MLNPQTFTKQLTRSQDCNSRGCGRQTLASGTYLRGDDALRLILLHSFLSKARPQGFAHRVPTSAARTHANDSRLPTLASSSCKPHSASSPLTRVLHGLQRDWLLCTNFDDGRIGLTLSSESCGSQFHGSCFNQPNKTSELEAHNVILGPQEISK